MAEPRPELLVVAGDQLGGRAILMTDEAFVGRSPDCELQILDTTVSRQHLRFVLAPGGWLVENVSTNPIRVNRKAFKTGRQIFLETGDVVRVGLHTDLLFVSPGDDPDEALQAYADTHPLVTAIEAGPEADVTPLVAPDDAGDTPTDEVPLTVEKPEMDEPVDEEELAQKKKLRRYTIIGGIWLGVMLVVIIGGVMIKGGKDDRPENPLAVPARLSAKDIQDVLGEALPRRTLNPVVAQRELQDARNYFRDRDVSAGYLYRAIKHFKRFEALSGRGSLGVDDERTFREATRILADRITAVYNSGYIYSRDQDWRKAKASFEHALALIPIKDPEPEPEESNPIWDNIRQHLTYVNGQISAGNQRRRR